MSPGLPRFSTDWRRMISMEGLRWCDETRSGCGAQASAPVAPRIAHAEHGEQREHRGERHERRVGTGIENRDHRGDRHERGTATNEAVDHAETAQRVQHTEKQYQILTEVL